MKAPKLPTVQCWNCKGEGHAEERILHVKSVSHRQTCTTKCFPCKGTGRVPSPFAKDYED